MLASTLASLALALCLSTEETLVREGEHFRLVCHFSNEQVADRALEAVEAVWDRFEEIYPLDDDAELLEVHLYRDAAGYEGADQELTGGQFKRNLAFAHSGTLSAHVALQPPLSDGALAELGAPTQTLRLLAHEAAHLARYSACANYRSHPRWLADGIAGWVDEQVCADLGLYVERAQDPHHSTGMVNVQRLLERGALPTVEQFLTDDLDDLEFHERYSVSSLYFRYLLEGQYESRFRKVLAEARRLGGGGDYTERLGSAALKIFGKSRLASINKGFAAHVRSQEPAWKEVFRSLSFEGSRGVQAAFDSNAIAWRRTPAGRRYTVAGKLTLLPGPQQQMNLLIGESERGFLSVAFSSGGIDLFEYLREGSAWHSRGAVKCAAVHPGQAFEFRVSVDGSDVRVEVDGAEVLTGAVEFLSLEGPWGLGAQARAAGIWELEEAPGL